MARMLDRARNPLDQLSSAVPFIPSALVALVGKQAVNRGMDQARDWLQDNWERGVDETRSTLKPLQKATRRELKKTRKLEGVVPFFPAIPLVPLVLLAGAAAFSTVVALQATRRERELEDRLDELEARFNAMRHREATEQQATLPWS